MRNKGTNLQLSNKELQLFENVDFFKAKRELTEKLESILAQTRTSYNESVEEFRNRLPAPLFANNGKISRGENYRGLPYLVLDYPAVFEKDGIIAFRTMFWWGHPATLTFHISGKYLEIASIPDEKFIQGISEDLLYTGINENQWVHHHESDNYITQKEFGSKGITLREHSKNLGFLKLMIKIPMEDISNLSHKGTKFVTAILKKLF